MDMKRNIIRLNQRLYQRVQHLALSSDKLVHKREFWAIVVAVLIFGLILAFIFAQRPLAGELTPVPFYPYAQ
jgi:hypothetical protein